MGRTTPNGILEHLLLKRSDNDGTYPGLWQVLTGTIDKDERAQDAARRELFEETGVASDALFVLPYVGSFFMIRKDAVQLIPTFGILVGFDTSITLSDEHTAFQWLDTRNALDTLFLPSHKDGTELFFRYAFKQDHFPLQHFQPNP